MKRDNKARERLIAYLHVLTLFSLAVAQPLFELISLEPMLLVTHRARPWEIVFLVATLCLFAPAMLIAAEHLAARIRPWLSEWLHLGIVALLLVLIALPAWKRIVLLPGYVTVGLALTTALAATWGYRRYAGLRLVVTFASPCVLLFPFWFMIREPVCSLVVQRGAANLQQGSGGNGAPVVMVLFDEFSGVSLMNEHREIDSLRYPNFAELAAHSTWFRNATTVDELTAAVVPALLTGLRPSAPAAPPTAANYPDNLFTLLGADYDATVFEPYTTLCPIEVDPKVVPHSTFTRLLRLSADLRTVYLRFLLPFDLVGPPPSKRMQTYNKWVWDVQRKKTRGLVRYNWQERRKEQFEHFLECLRPRGEKPPLYFLHIVLPHAAYEYLPSGRQHLFFEGFVTPTPSGSARWSSDALEVAQHQQQYLLQLAFVDQLLGRLLARLREVKLYDDCLLVVTADHGVAFQTDQTPRDATRATCPEIMPVPLFIKAPGQTTRHISDRNVETIDVLPTIAHLLEIKLPWQPDGQSALDPASAERPSKLMHSASHGKMIFDRSFPEKDAALLNQLLWFGSGSKPLGLYRIGPHDELVGKSLAELQLLDEATLEIEFTDYQSLRDASPRDRLAPCYVDGKFAPDLAAKLPVELAVAINGTIWGVTRTYKVAGHEDEWRVTVPEEAFRDGENDIRVFVIKTEDGELQLEPTIRLR